VAVLLSKAPIAASVMLMAVQPPIREMKICSRSLQILLASLTLPKIPEHPCPLQAQGGALLSDSRPMAHRGRQLLEACRRQRVKMAGRQRIEQGGKAFGERDGHCGVAPQLAEAAIKYVSDVLVNA
jgi:hypothetical protein